MNKKIIRSVIGMLFLAVTIVSYNYYQKIFGKSVLKHGVIYIESKATYEDIEKKLSTFIDNIDDFNWVANLKKMQKAKAGRYILKKGMSNNGLVNLLRSGSQAPIKVSFSNQDTLEKLARRISQQIEADSSSLIKAFTDKKFLFAQGVRSQQILEKFIPNSYEFYWNTSAEQFRDRMFKESSKFWNKNRSTKAKNLGMSISEVITLASIVQKETTKIIERPIVAGLYINRIKRGIPLQADPTIIYALKQINGQDYTVKRVLNKDLKIKSAYNTYLNRGLPPSLIGMPDISSIDAVLNYEKHNYLYMCADIEKVGFHAFASTLKQHNRNAKKYQRWLNKQEIIR